MLSKLLLTILPRRPVRMIGNCCLTVAIALILILVAGCASIMFIAGRASAAPARGPDILLMLDHSQSLWELGGIGSDPDMLHVDAARLFINTLGVDQDLTYRLGIIAFGTDARLAAPLTPLADTDQRRTLLKAVVNPQPMGWTDVNKALALAYDQLFPGGRPAPDRQPTIILMTDGRPEIETTDTAQARQAYLNELEGRVRQFADQGTVFHTVLLSNQATDADPELQTVYRPLWLKLSREFDTVYFHEARTAADLPAIYHAIVVGLQGAQTAGPVIEESLAGHVKKKITVEPGLYRVTFVIRKSKPDIDVGIMRPNGASPQASTAGVRFAEDRLQEVWSVRDPAPGTWTVTLDGQGEVTVWKDFVPAPPTPTPTATAPHIDNMPAIRDRLPQIANLPPVNLLDGTGQVRSLGLLALLWHVETVQQALKDPLWELAHKQNLGTLDGMRIDASRGISVFQVGSLYGTFFASFGPAELGFPADAVTTWCTYRHARVVISQGLLSPPVEDEVQRAVESTLQAQELTLDALHQYLPVDDAGIPLAVELQPPARIRDADAHAVPQLAMNYVQAYRRQRVEGDFRIWIRENARRRQEHLLRGLSASIQAATDDPTRGLRFAHAFAQGVGTHLANLAAALTARRQALQSERSDRETQLNHSLTDLMHAPESGWLFRGQVVEKALDQYFKDAQDFLETQLELSVLDGAIAVVVAAQEHAEAWAHNLNTLVNRLQAIEGELQRGQHNLADELLAPARSSRLALVDSSYLERLYQKHAPSTSATLGALLEDRSHAPHRWIGWTRDTVEQMIIRAARQPFEAIRELSVEQVIQDRSDQMTARQWVQMLAQKARPAWNLNEVLLPEGAANLARIELLGVPDRERSIYAGDAARLVSTSDLHRITAFAMTAGAPFAALRRYEDYLRGYQRVRGKRPLHVLPDFLADGQSARLAFALGHIYGFITDRGVYYYYQPADELDEPIKLAQGKENAIQALGGRDGLVREVMQRVEARIEDVGFDQAQQDLRAFCTPAPHDDDLTRELKRLVRDYAERLRERRLA